MAFPDATVLGKASPLGYDIRYLVNDFATAADTCIFAYSQEILTFYV